LIVPSSLQADANAAARIRTQTERRMVALQQP
jgi:hypothetical protein